MKVSAAFATGMLLIGLVGAATAYGALVPTGQPTRFTPTQDDADTVYGTGVALAGDHVLVAASGGGLYEPPVGDVFFYEPAGDDWQETRFHTPAVAENGFFAQSIAASGRDFVAGMPYFDNGSGWAGAAIHYGWDGADWTQTTLLASDSAAGDRFGGDVAMQAGRVLVGAAGAYNGAPESGAAYLFEYTPTGWVETKFTPSDARERLLFGSSVALDGDRIVIAAADIGYWADPAPFSGTVYVFDKTPAGWVETKLRPAAAHDRDSFAHSVAVEGDTIVAGAHLDDDNGFYSGSAYVFKRQADGTWSEEKLLPEGGQPQDRFGQDVAVDGEVVAVSATGVSTPEEVPPQGAVFVFYPDGTGGWAQIKITRTDGQSVAAFGRSIAMDDGLLLVGAPLAKWDGGRGVAFLYALDIDGDCVTDRDERAAGTNPFQADGPTPVPACAPFQALGVV